MEEIRDGDTSDSLREEFEALFLRPEEREAMVKDTWYDCYNHGLKGIICESAFALAPEGPYFLRRSSQAFRSLPEEPYLLWRSNQGFLLPLSAHSLLQKARGSEE